MTTIKLNDAQRKALTAVAIECSRQASFGNPAQCVGSPKGVRIDTLQSLRRIGLLEREYSPFGGKACRYSWSLTSAAQTEAK